MIDKQEVLNFGFKFSFGYVRSTRVRETRGLSTREGLRLSHLRDALAR